MTAMSSKRKKFPPYSLQEQVDHLRSLNRRGRLALFVGAGVSVGCGLPDWDGLLRALARRANLDLSTVKLDQVADTARQHLGEDFNEAVADCLYQNDVVISETMRAIVKSGVRRFATFNFDDLLEEALHMESVEHKVVLNGESFNNNYPGCLIFHPHGILERFMSTDEHRSCSIILSDSDYRALYDDPYCLTNLIQLSLLINFSILFVGMSLADPNTKRLLETAHGLGVRHWHYAILRKPGDAELLQKKTRRFRRLGIDPVWIKDFSAIPRVFRDLRVRRKTKVKEALLC